MPIYNPPTSQLTATSPQIPDVILQDQQTSGTATSTIAVSTFAPRVINTIVRNNGSIASLASNQVTLPAGSYVYEIQQNIMVSGSSTTYIAFRTYDNTHTVVLCRDPSTENGGAIYDYFRDKNLTNSFILTSSSAVSFDAAWTGGGPVTDGNISPVSISGQVEVNKTIRIWKVA